MVMAISLKCFLASHTKNTSLPLIDNCVTFSLWLNIRRHKQEMIFVVTVECVFWFVLVCVYALPGLRLLRDDRVLKEPAMTFPLTTGACPWETKPLGASSSWTSMPSNSISCTPWSPPTVLRGSSLIIIGGNNGPSGYKQEYLITCYIAFNFQAVKNIHYITSFGITVIQRNNFRD